MIMTTRRSSEYDVVVVGARCAGSPTAMLLAQRGHRVLVVDRATFPADTISTHYLHQPAVASLARWGLLDEVIATGCPPLPSQRLDFGDVVLVAAPPPVCGVADGYCVRRTVLDSILIRAASAAGAEVREGFSVHSLMRDGDRVAGIAGTDGRGQPQEVRATVVVGADGRHSFVARAVGAPAYDEQPARTCAYYSYWSGVRVDDVELYPRNGHFIAAAPTNDGKVMVIAYWPHERFAEVRADIPAAFDSVLDLAPGLAERLRCGHREEAFRGAADLAMYFRRPYGPGWALVGDAGHHKDPVLALGITDAFRDAEFVAEALHAGLSRTQSFEEALAAYERSRNEAAAQGYRNTLQFAALQSPPSDLLALVAALTEQPAQASRFMGATIGTVPAAEFFAPDNVAAIMGAQGVVAS